MGHQGATYNCGLLLAQGVQSTEYSSSVESEAVNGVEETEIAASSSSSSYGQQLSADPIPAFEYFQKAYLFNSSTSTGEAARIAHTVLSDTLAFLPLSSSSLSRILQAGSLAPQSSHLHSLFSSACIKLHEFETCFARHEGNIATCKVIMREIVKILGEIVEKYSSSLSPLQLYLSLDALQDIIGPLASDSEAFAMLAGRYAEAYALSYYCKGKYAVQESDAACFNGAVSSAVSYYRRAGKKQEAERVVELARAHPMAATHWRDQTQTPRVFYLNLTAKPW